MTQLSTQTVRFGGRPDVFTALLAVAGLMLLTGVIFVAFRNIDQTSTTGKSDGSPFKYLEK